MAGTQLDILKDPGKARESKILEVIISFARLDFTGKAPISDSGDEFDAIAAGVNMLGEELKSSTVSLREKDQLLREIHHRVKNNLQIISSLLNLQTESVKDKKFLALIRESRNRIKTMALVHEMLYATSDLSSIKLKEYLKILYKSIYDSYKRPGMAIDLKLDIESKFCFEIDRMIPLGLIINEVISNSLKYAFPKNKGAISIVLKEKGGRYALTVSDNGKGLPKTFDVKKDANLGIQLIFMLSEQLNGSVKLENKKGTCYTLNF